MKNNRRFSRVSFSTTASIFDGDTVAEVTVLDLSIHGLRICSPAAHSLSSQPQLSVYIELSESAAISLNCRPVFRQDDEIGLEILRMDVDSAAHLRRLLTLNLGDSALVERDLQALMAD